MREILFRGKPLINPKLDFVYGSLSIFKDCYSIKENKEFAIPTPINSETLGQFTGIKDKNGIKIFEGDIIINTSKNSLSNKPHIVEFKPIGGYIYLEPEREPLVIGNIYDNPEEYKTEV